jgi:hypothetical protein
MTTTINKDFNKKKSENSEPKIESILTETNKLLKIQNEEYKKAREEAKKRFESRNDKKYANSNKTEQNKQNKEENKKSEELKNERKTDFDNFFRLGSSNQRTLGTAIGGVPGYFAGALLGGPLSAVGKHYWNKIRKKWVDRKTNGTTSNVGAGNWNAQEKAAAPINNLSTTVNKKLDKIIKIMSGKSSKEKNEDGLLKKFGDKIWDLIKGAGVAAGGLGLLKTLKNKFKSGWNKTKDWTKRKLGLSKEKPVGGTKNTTRKSNTLRKSNKKIKPRTKVRARGKAGVIINALAAAGLGAGIGSLFTDDEETADALNNVAGTALNGAYYANGAYDAYKVGSAVKKANGVKNAINAGRLATAAGGVGSSTFGGPVGGAVTTAANIGFTAADIYSMEKQRKELLRAGNEREARKLRAQQWIKGTATAAGTIGGGAVGALIGGAGGTVVAPGAGTAAGGVAGAAVGSGVGSSIGAVGGDALSWLYGKGYDMYYNWKDRREKAKAEKAALETQQAMNAANSMAMGQLPEQINIVIDLLSQLAQNLSPTTQSELDRNYLNMVLANKNNGGAGVSGSNNFSAPNLNMINPVV